jgi:hypothetical protein
VFAETPGDILLADALLTSEIIRSYHVSEPQQFVTSVKEWTTENNEATAEDRPLSAESALDRDTQEYIHYLLDGKFNPRYLESFGELLSAICESEMKNFDFVPTRPSNIDPGEVEGFRDWYRERCNLRSTDKRIWEKRIAEYAQYLTWEFMPQDLDSFMLLRERLAVNDRRELCGETREDHEVGKDGKWIDITQYGAVRNRVAETGEPPFVYLTPSLEEQRASDFNSDSGSDGGALSCAILKRIIHLS